MGPAAGGGAETAVGGAGIDAGTSAFGAPRTDRAGAQRRDDRAVPNRGSGRPDWYDMGAYERTGR